jgi:hypothetical protein
MSGFFENLLKDTAKGFFGNEYLRDYTHASKTFRTNSYGYAPKFKFLFHVYFDINKDLISATQSWDEDSNFGLAVKSVELPKYQFEVSTLNQYNRKRLVQTKIKYQPISIKFHDDNNNIIRNMWNVYYTYYYKDATQDLVKTNANKRNIYQPSIQGDEDWGFIGEGTDGPTPSNSSLGMSKPAFFKSIDVFGFNQHNFVQYKLINPIIASFEHDTYAYAESGVMENSMSIDYETVKYYEGALDGRTPGQLVKEFGSEKHYDTRLSPIARPGSNASILGQGGLVDAVGGIINDLPQNPLGAIQKLGASIQTFKNPANILKIAKGEALGVAADAITNTPNRNTLFNFPAAAQSGSNAFNKAVTGIISPSSVPANPSTTVSTNKKTPY